MAKRITKFVAYWCLPLYIVGAAIGYAIGGWDNAIIVVAACVSCSATGLLIGMSFDKYQEASNKRVCCKAPAKTRTLIEDREYPWS